MVDSCTERNVTVNPTYGFDLNPCLTFYHTNGKLLPNTGCSQVTKDVVQTAERVIAVTAAPIHTNSCLNEQ